MLVVMKTQRCRRKSEVRTLRDYHFQIEPSKQILQPETKSDARSVTSTLMPPAVALPLKASLSKEAHQPSAKLSSD